ncbi:MAG TPA: hypothetical protein VNV86_01835 [Candidatus Acidoferrum sp.]|nr:hypothetical protein [Candidatus Acidoferrum sp.]
MQRFFESKFAFFAVCAVFTLALLWNLSHSSEGLLAPHGVDVPDSITAAHGATAPPDPWENVKLAHGATAPPDPWENIKLAHGATAPPDPWENLRG